MKNLRCFAHADSTDDGRQREEREEGHASVWRVLHYMMIAGAAHPNVSGQCCGSAGGRRKKDMSKEKSGNVLSTLALMLLCGSTEAPLQ